MTGAVGLDPPDGHVVADAEIPRCVDGAMGVGLKGGGEVAAGAEVHELGEVDGAVLDGVKGFVWSGGVFLAHEHALCFTHGDVPMALSGGDGGAGRFFDGVEVVGIFGGDGGRGVGEGVLGMEVPGEEEKFKVESGEGLADVVHGGHDEVVVLPVFAAFVGGLCEDAAVLGDRIERACDNFLGADGVVDGDVAELGDVEELEGAAAGGGGCDDGGAVGEADFVAFGGEVFDFTGGGDGAEAILDEATDFGEFDVSGRGVGREVVEVIVGEGDFGDFGAGVVEFAIDDGGLEVGGEEAGVEDEEGDVGGDAELADFEDEVAGVGGVVEGELSPVHGEALKGAVFVDDPVKGIEACKTV